MLLLFSDNLDDDEKWSLKAWEDLLLKVRPSYCMNKQNQKNPAIMSGLLKQWQYRTHEYQLSKAFK